MSNIFWMFLNGIKNVVQVFSSRWKVVILWLHIILHFIIFILDELKIIKIE